MKEKTWNREFVEFVTENLQEEIQPDEIEIIHRIG